MPGITSDLSCRSRTLHSGSLLRIAALGATLGSREPGAEEMVISSIGDVERIHSSPVRLWNLHGPIALCIPDLLQSERERFESRLNQLTGVCGCAEASVMGAITLLAITAFWIQRAIPFSYQSILTAGVTVIAAALLAKLLRVVTARILLRQMLGDLLRTLPHKSPVKGVMR